MPEDRSDFVRLLTRHERQVYAYILSLVPNWADADEILQETNIRLWDQFDQFKPGTDFGAWARTVAHYQVLTFRKRVGRERLHFSQEFVDAVQTEYDTSASASILDERRDALASCVEKLSPGQQEMLRQAYSHEHSIKDVAVQLKRPAGAVYRALSRIRRTLHDCVSESLRQRGAGMSDPTGQADDLFDELHELITARIDDNISDEQLRRLEDLVINHPEARRIYVQHMRDSAALTWWATTPGPHLGDQEVDRYAQSLLQIAVGAELGEDETTQVISCAAGKNGHRSLRPDDSTAAPSAALCRRGFCADVTVLGGFDVRHSDQFPSESNSRCERNFHAGRRLANRRHSL